MCEQGTKTNPVFLPADFFSFLALRHGDTVDPENMYFQILKAVTDQVWDKAKK